MTFLRWISVKSRPSVFGVSSGDKAATQRGGGEIMSVFIDFTPPQTDFTSMKTTKNVSQFSFYLLLWFFTYGHNKVFFFAVVC